MFARFSSEKCIATFAGIPTGPRNVGEAERSSVRSGQKGQIHDGCDSHNIHPPFTASGQVFPGKIVGEND